MKKFNPKWPKALVDSEVPQEHLTTIIKKSISSIEKLMTELDGMKAVIDNPGQYDEESVTKANEDFQATTSVLETLDKEIIGGIKKYAKGYPDNYNKNVANGEKLKQARQGKTKEQAPIVEVVETAAPIVEQEQQDAQTAALIEEQQQQQSSTQTAAATEEGAGLEPVEKKKNNAGKIIGWALFGLGAVAAAFGINAFVSNKNS